MPAGDAITLPYQYEWRNLVYGSGTHIIVEGTDGLHETPDVGTNDIDRQTAHGTHPGGIYAKSRIVTQDVVITGAPGEDIENKLAVVQRTFQLPRIRYSRISEPLVFSRPGLPTRMVMARLTKRAFRSEFDVARGKARGSVQFVCADPRIYSLNESSHDIVLAGGATNGQDQIENLGDFQDGVAPFITITGPATNPTIQNSQDDERTIKLNIVLDAGDTLTIDVARKLIELNGVRVFPVAQDNQWWAVLPGMNTVNYNRQAGNTGAASTLTIEWRDTWL